MTKLTSSGYKAINKEANFGSPIRDEVVGGMHIAPELITKNGKRFYAVHWFHGLPRHDKLNAIRFPHGLMIYGESIMDFAKRIVAEQLHMKVKSVRVLTMESYVDKEKHWHIEPEILAEVYGNAKKPVKDSQIVSFQLMKTPDMAFWKRSEFIKFIKKYL